MLRGESIDANQLDEVISKLRELEDDRAYQDVNELARLQAFVAEGLKRFEFGLRRKVEGEASAAALSGRTTYRRVQGASSGALVGR